MSVTSFSFYPYNLSIPRKLNISDITEKKAAFVRVHYRHVFFLGVNSLEEYDELFIMILYNVEFCKHAIGHLAYLSEIECDSVPRLRASSLYTKLSHVYLSFFNRKNMHPNSYFIASKRCGESRDGIHKLHGLAIDQWNGFRFLYITFPMRFTRRQSTKKDIWLLPWIISCWVCPQMILLVLQLSLIKSQIAYSQHSSSCVW